MRVCGVCGSDKFTQLAEINLLDQGYSIIPTVFSVVRCSFCEFIFNNVNANQDIYDDYYKSAQKYSLENMQAGTADLEWDRSRLSKTSELISNKITADQDILDIGCGGGGLLELLSQKGFKNLYGYDGSEGCINLVKSKIPSFSGFSGNFKAVDFYNIFNKKFDCIVISHVLEHIYDLKNFILSIKGALKDNGILYIEVPDTSRYFNFFYGPFHYFSAEHINHFTKDSLSKLFGLIGLECLELVEKEIEASESAIYPAIAMFFKRSPRYLSDKTAIDKYISLSRDFSYENIESKLLGIGGKFCIWGAGNFTRALIAKGVFEKFMQSIDYIVDKDVGLHGSLLGKLIVSNPKVLKGYSGTIVISASIFSKDIARDIRLMGFAGKVIEL